MLFTTSLSFWTTWCWNYCIVKDHKPLFTSEKTMLMSSALPWLSLSSKLRTPTAKLVQQETTLVLILGLNKHIPAYLIHRGEGPGTLMAMKLRMRTMMIIMITIKSIHIIISITHYGWRYFWSPLQTILSNHVVIIQRIHLNLRIIIATTNRRLGIDKLIVLQAIPRRTTVEYLIVIIIL